jgi:hypothetical protein
MSATWNYMVDFLSGEHIADAKVEEGLTDAFCLYVEMFMIDPDATITYRENNEAEEPGSEGLAYAQV